MEDHVENFCRITKGVEKCLPSQLTLAFSLQKLIELQTFTGLENFLVSNKISNQRLIQGFSFFLSLSETEIKNIL